MLTEQAKKIYSFLETTGEKIVGNDDSKEYAISCFLCTDKRQRLSVNKETGRWNCLNCTAGGKKFSNLEWAFKNRKKVKNNDTIEKTEQELKCKIPPNFHKQYFKEIFNTKDNDCAKYLMKERGFSQDAIKHFELGFRWEFASRRGTYDAGDHLVIPYIKEGKCVNVKYRKLKPESKKDKWRREEGGVSALYNDAVLDDFDYNEIIIAESELDAISIWEMGYKNVIGLTTGANGFKNKPEWVDRLERFDKVYLVLDADQAGQDGARNLATMLGLGRCLNVLLPEDANDPNDFLLNKKYDVNYFTDLLGHGTKFEVRNTKSLRQHHKKFHHEKFVTKERAKSSKYDTPWKPVNRVLGPLNDGYLFVLGGKPKAGKCEKFDSIVINPIDMTPLTIEQAIKNKQETIHSYNEETKKIEVCKISDWIDSGVKPLVRVETKIGRAVETTYSHRYLTFEGWKFVSDIKIGEKIAVPTNLGFFGDGAWPVENIHLIASLIADGGLTSGSVMYTKEDKKLVDMVGNASLKSFNTPMKPTNSKFQYRITDGDSNTPNLVMDECRRLGIDCLSKHKKIPDEIFSLKKELLSEFIGMLWSHDGSIYTSKGRNTSIGYSSSSEKLIDGLNHLLIRFGINLKKRYKKAKLKDKYFDSWILETNQAEPVSKFLDCIPLYGEKSDRKVQLSEKMNRDYITAYPTEMWKVVRSECKVAKTNISQLWRKVIGYEPDYRGHRFKIKGGCSREMLTKINIHLKSTLLQSYINSDISFVEVTKIEDIGSHQCYDLTVPKNENFLVNDIVAHNTSIAMDMMKHWAKKGHNAGIYSCEMRGERLHDKWLMSEPHKYKSKSGIDDIDELAFYRSCLRLPSNNLHMFNPTIQTDLLIDGVIENSEAMVKRYGLKILVVDNLHYLCRGGDENAMVSEATQKLKLLAERLDIMVVLIVHPRKTNTNKQLKPEELKGSSSIIQDADVIWLQHRPFQNDDMKEDEIKTGYAKHDPMSFKTDISITGRFTEGGRTFLYFSGAYSTFKCDGIGYESILSEFGSGGKKQKRKKRGL